MASPRRGTGGGGAGLRGPRAVSVVVTHDPSPGVMEEFLAGLSAFARREQMPVQLVVAHHLGAIPVLHPGDGAEFLSLELIPGAAGDQEAAIWEGLRRVCHPVVVTLDPDMAGNIEDIPRLLALHESGADLVYARRVRRADAPLSRVLLSWLFNLAVRAMARVPLHDVNTPMTLMSEDARAVLLQGLSPRDPYKVLMYRRFASSFAEVPVRVARGRKRSSHYRLGGLLRLAYFRLLKIHRVRAAGGGGA